MNDKSKMIGEAYMMI